ncbi:MAG: HD domain-containing protein [Chitinophagaceae bacterium]
MTPKTLLDYWQHLVEKFPADKTVKQELYLQLEKDYNSPGRYYHSTQHILKLLELTEEYASFITDKITVQFSIFYHDVIYKAGLSQNEKRSAKRASEELALLGVESHVITKVSEYILATEDHAANTLIDDDLKFFLDFDLSILASSEEEYETYMLNMRKEYQKVPLFLYKTGRAGFLKKLLKQYNIFFTPAFVMHDKKARQNMEWELREGLNRLT